MPFPSQVSDYCVRTGVLFFFFSFYLFLYLFALFLLLLLLLLVLVLLLLLLLLILCYCSRTARRLPLGPHIQEQGSSGPLGSWRRRHHAPPDTQAAGLLSGEPVVRIVLPCSLSYARIAFRSSPSPFPSPSPTHSPTPSPTTTSSSPTSSSCLGCLYESYHAFVLF